MTLLLDVVARGAQVLLATHSPVLAALPGARLLEVGPWGIRPAEWRSLEVTENWRAFLADPEAFLRRLS
ncbi:MAG: family ATPase [Frankiales bacterium]|nr:family ATPase [Frankiales bacterium]